MNETEKRDVVLREWFDRVDSEKSGSITALQLKVIDLVLLIEFAIHINYYYYNYNSVIGFDNQTALAVGNLEFPLSVVEQMIRSIFFSISI